MLAAEITTLANTIFFPFMPVITVSALMLSDLPWDDDEDEGGLITKAYNFALQGA